MFLGILLIDPLLADNGRVAEELFQIPISGFDILQSRKHRNLLTKMGNFPERRRRQPRRRPGDFRGRRTRARRRRGGNPRFEKSTSHTGSLMKKLPIQAVQKRLDARPPKS
jgi:hypothetical protein